MKVLVIGGGYAGIKTALDYATNDEVYLVARGDMGGTFLKIHSVDGKSPSSILNPLIQRLKEDEKVHIYMNTVIEGVKEKEEGGFVVTFYKMPVRVDENKCDLCGECWKVCPIRLPDRYNEWLVNGSAIYSGGAISYAIEKETPFCQATCPAGLDVRGYVGLIADGKFKEAYEIIKDKVPFPGVLGRVCPHPCENRCKRGLIDEPIAIAKLKRFVADYAHEHGYEGVVAKCERRGKKVAIIGAGPAGLAAAYDLKKLGYDVTVFEKLPVAGGMLAVGIPRFRLPREVLEREIAFIKNMGVEIRTNEEVDKGRFEEICGSYDAVFVSVGTHVGKRMGIEGEDLEGVIAGIDFLRDLNLGKTVKIGRRVAVIGGGNVAIDVARCVLRLGSQPLILYRRSKEDMPASKEEIEALEKEGIEIMFLTAPIRI
ncbi:MAG: FAD-dependent oxidoreductase, partial [Candidatus Methanospirareceae archaeon]